MAIRVKAPESEEKEDQRSLVAIVKGKLIALLRKCSTAEGNMEEARGELGGIINNAVDKDHLHKGSFQVIRRLNRMDAVKRNEWLFHFDVMRGHMAWETSDLLEDRPPAGTDVRRAPVEDLGEGLPA